MLSHSMVKIIIRTRLIVSDQRFCGSLCVLGIVGFTQLCSSADSEYGWNSSESMLLFEGIDGKFPPSAGTTGTRFSLVYGRSLGSNSVGPELAGWSSNVTRRNRLGRDSTPLAVTRVSKTCMLVIRLGSRVSITRLAG